MHPPAATIPLAATISTGAFCLIECHGGRMHRRQTVARSAVDFRFQLLNHQWDERPPCPPVAHMRETNSASVGRVLGAYRTFGRPPATSQFDPNRTLPSVKNLAW